MEVHSCESSEKMMEKINAQNVEGVEVLSFKRLPDDAKNAMSVLAAADYMVSIQPPAEEVILNYMAQEEIPVLKKTKKSEKVVNIRQMIYELKPSKNGIFMKLAQGSASNLKPELVVESLYRFMGKEAPEQISLERLDMYCLKADFFRRCRRRYDIMGLNDGSEVNYLRFLPKLFAWFL